MTQEMEQKLSDLIDNLNDLVVALEGPARRAPIDPAVAFTHVPAKDSAEEHILILFSSGKIRYVPENGGTEHERDL